MNKKTYIKPSIDLLKDGENSLKGFIQSERFLKKIDGVDICLGMAEDGEKHIVDLTKMPNLLIAGASGTGKTVFLNSLIVGLLYKYSPEDLQMVIFDPKMFEYNKYKNLSHMLFPEPIKDYNEAIEVLEKLIDEMNKRREILYKSQKEDIVEYNKDLDIASKPLPRIILIIDELADFIMQSDGSIDFIMNFVALSLFGKKVGIHVITATQRPVEEVVTGLVENKVFAKVAFRLSDENESKDFLGIAGAEKLKDCGNMLFLSSEIEKLIRMQGAYVSPAEIKEICDFIRTNKY